MYRWKVAMVGLGVLAASVLLALAARGSGVDRPAADRPAASNAPGELPPGHPQEMGIPHPHRVPDIELTDSQVAELLDALKTRWPTAHARLMRVKQERSRTYQRALQLYWQMYRRWKDAPKDVQEAYVALPEMRVQVGDLLRDFHKATDADKPALKQKLRNLLAKQLNAEHAVNRYRLTMLEKAVKQLRDDLQREADQRDQIIDNRLDTLLESRAAAPDTRPSTPQESKTRPASHMRPAPGGNGK